jgi:DNA-binding CsgD family transcriptional regulator/catechol 2,3-dioxygenase-like lactoylglutathione lyase family enzyme
VPPRAKTRCMTGKRGRPSHPDILTAAEWKVAEQVRHGLTNRRIAERTGVSPDAVKFHVGNVLAKLGLSSRRELQLWDGVAAHSALGTGRTAMNDGSQGENYVMLGQIARTTANAAEAREWYRDVLGLPELYSFGNLAFFDLGGVRLMLTEEGGDGKAESILYLGVPDIHAAKAELEGRGVVFTHAPHLIHRHKDGTEEWMAFFTDNEGRPLALMTQVRSAVR